MTQIPAKEPSLSETVTGLHKQASELLRTIQLTQRAKKPFFMHDLGPGKSLQEAKDALEAQIAYFRAFIGEPGETTHHPSPPPLPPRWANQK